MALVLVAFLLLHFLLRELGAGLTAHTPRQCALLILPLSLLSDSHYIILSRGPILEMVDYLRSFVCGVHIHIVVHTVI